MLARYGIPVARGQVAATAAEAEGAAERLGPPVVVKAQVLTAAAARPAA